MPITPGPIQAVVGLGSEVDCAQVTNSTPTTVYRQVVSVGDPQTWANVQTVDSSGNAQVKSTDGSLATIGTKTDAKDSHTDSTSVSAISLLKQLSSYLSGAALETGGNLATLAGIVSSSKAAVKSADGDFVTLGTKTDAADAHTDSTSISIVSVLKQISKLLQSALAVTVASLPLPSNAAQETGGNLATLAGSVSSSKVQVSENAATNSGSTSLQSAAGSTGNGSNLSVAGYATAMLTVTGASSPIATVVFEGTEDGTNWFGLNALQVGLNDIGNGNIGQVVTSHGVSNGSALFAVPCAGLQSVRARISAWTQGTVTVTGHASPMVYTALAQQSVISNKAGTALGTSSSATDLTTVLQSIPLLWDGTSAGSAWSQATTDGQSTSRVGAVSGLLYNGTNYDRPRGSLTADANAATGLPAAAPQLYNGSTWDRTYEVPSSDAQARAGIQAAGQMRYNGTNWDRHYNGNDPITALASAARTSFTASAAFTNYNWAGIVVDLNITNIVTACSLQIGLLPGGGAWYMVPFTTAVTATGHWVYVYCPGATATPYGATGGTAAFYPTPLPGGSFTIQVFHNNSNAITYSVTLYPVIFS